MSVEGIRASARNDEKSASLLVHGPSPWLPWADLAAPLGSLLCAGKARLTSVDCSVYG
jgi:hypothetical protein